MPVAAVEEAYLYSLSRDLLSAAVRLGILGPMHGNPPPPITLQQPSSPARVIETARLSEPAALANDLVVCCGTGVALQRQLAPLVWELLSEVEALSLDANTAAQTAPFIETLQVSRTNLSGVLLVFVGQMISRSLLCVQGNHPLLYSRLFQS